MKPEVILRWMALAPTILAGWLVSCFAGAWLAGKLHFSIFSGGGFTSAFVVVVIAYIVAPAFKIRSAIYTFIVGALVASCILLITPFSDSRYGYQWTSMHLVSTIGGGILALGILLLRETRLTHKIR